MCEIIRYDYLKYLKHKTQFLKKKKLKKKTQHSEILIQHLSFGFKCELINTISTVSKASILTEIINFDLHTF